MSVAQHALVLAGVALLVVGCESTQDKSARLAKEGGPVSVEKGLRITRESRDVKVGGTRVLNDRNGTAAVVEVRNTGKRTLVDVPLAIDVLARGKSVFRNDAPGLEPSLVSVAALRPGERLTWVNDQVLVPGSKLEAKAGAPRTEAPRELPKIEIGPPRVGGDPTSGLAVEGKLTNRSDVLQRKLVIYAVARRGGKVVAAGRGQIERLRPRKPTAYQVFFIGNPKGAQVELAAPPTTFH